MRHATGLICVMVLAVAPIVGCGGGDNGEGGRGGSAGTGGVGGSAGMAGMGGSAGIGGMGGFAGAGGSAGTGGVGGSAGMAGMGGSAGIGGMGGSAGAGGIGGAAGAGGMGGSAGACQGTLCRCTEAGVRSAIAAGGGPYTFDCAGLQTVVTEAEIVIGSDVVLDGEGQLVLDGNFGHRVLSVQDAVTAELRGIEVIQGNDSTNRAGGILNDGTLTLTDSGVSANVGGGLRNFGAATVTRSNVSDNQGGGLRNEFMATMTLTDSTVSGNVADDFGEGGGIWSDGALLSIGNTISGNVAGVEGGGIYNSGSLTLLNTTVSGNAAGSLGGGIYSDDSTVNMALVNSTVANNSAPVGSAVSSNSVALLTLRGTILQGTCGGSSVFTSDGYNLESPGDTCGFGQVSDQVNVTAMSLSLGPLADNGGPTQTHALETGSVGIDVIVELDCVDANGDPLTIDQRGEPRPGGTLCDVGAFEVQP